MSDDAAIYQNFSKSRKCWAHLLRRLVHEIMRLMLTRELFVFVTTDGVEGNNNASERELPDDAQRRDTGRTNKKPRGAQRPCPNRVAVCLLGVSRGRKVPRRIAPSPLDSACRLNSSSESSRTRPTLRLRIVVVRSEGVNSLIPWVGVHVLACFFTGFSSDKTG